MSSSYNKHESKYFNTALIMNEALLKLLTIKDYEYISVSELCKVAGVNRSTFYLHYLGMDDLLKETLEYKNDEFNKKLNIDREPDVINDSRESLVFISPKFLIPYLTYVKENKKLFVLAKKKPYVFGVNKMFNKTMKELVNPILDKFEVPDIEKKYTAAFFISGVQSIVMEWVNANCEDDIEYVSNIIISYVIKDRYYGK